MPVACPLDLTVDWEAPSLEGDVAMVTGSINGIVTLGGAYLQQKIGKILDHCWDGALSADGLRIYSSTDYKTALEIIPLTVFLSFVLSCFLTERSKPLKDSPK